MRLLQKLSEDDPDRRVQFCEWALSEVESDTDFATGILFSDEASFYVSGELNRQNTRYWPSQNPHWFHDSKKQGSERVMVWCGLWYDRLSGPFFFDENVTGEKYLEMLDTKAFASILNPERQSIQCGFSRMEPLLIMLLKLSHIWTTSSQDDGFVGVTLSNGPSVTLTSHL